MSPHDFKALLKDLVKNIDKSKRPVMVESSPGAGKTQIVGQAAKELGVGFIALHAPLMPPEDYGMPVIHGAKRDQLKFVVSKDKFPLEDSDHPDSGILLIDELSQADNNAQKILANLFQEREIHGHKLKEGWLIVATGNRITDRAGANRILGHLGNRRTRIELEVSLDDWTQWALSNGVAPELVAFIRFRPGLLSAYDPKLEANATPRSWVEGVGARMGIIPRHLEHAVFSGDVGEGPAAEFLAFLKIYRNLPNPDSILLNPKKAPVPEDAATQYAVCGALLERVTEQNFGRAFTYIERISPEFTVLFAKGAQAKDPDVVMSPEFIDWASSKGAKLLS